MVEPSITIGSVTFTFQDGDMSEVNVNLQGNLDENPLPASNSSNTFVVDFNGVIKTINLSGRITPATTSRTSTGSTTTIAQQLAWLETNLVNGTQSGATFNSNFQTNKNVYFRKLSYKEESGNPNFVECQIEMIEAA
jgi:hypothetical protein